MTDKLLSVKGKVVSESGDVVFQSVNAVILVVCNEDATVRHWHGSMEIESGEKPCGFDGQIVTDGGTAWNISIPPIQEWEKYPAFLFWGRGDLPAGV